MLVLTIWYPNAENPILGTFVHEQAVALRNSGIDIRIVQPIPSTPFPVTLLKESYAKLAKTPLQEEYEGFEVYHPRYVTLPGHLFFERVGDWMYRAIRPLIKRIYQEWPFDIIHAHTTYPCGYAANLLRDQDFPSVKVIHTIHRTCIIDAPNYNRQCYEKVRTALEGADRDVFVSLEGQNLALKYTEGRCENKSEYITNGVNTAKFQLDASDQAEVASLKRRHESTWNLVFVGYLNERKGIKELLSAVANLAAKGRRKLHLFLVGRNDLGTYIEDFIRTNGLAEMVTLVGPVLHDRVKIWMSFANAFILPSHSEGLPTVLFEALYAGTPSIFTKVGGVGDIVTDGQEALVIEPKSIVAIEESIVRLMDSPDLCRELRTNGHQLIRDNFTWAINADRNINLYGSLTQIANSSQPKSNRQPDTGP
ncbi:MAG: glycosyltransferase [Gammaproteobacteria bacterium]|nr:glycosyltransferase [Gammaproteobacteria bacterium]MBU2435831.1 glycosyltransferase [Gammaproteobacteria bacterium]MBU2449388.1 glycosyltransferase [Gammaproteobacteria bacterium]